MLSACGGDGGGINPNVAAVTSSSVGVPQYGQPLLITLNGRNLDKPISVGALGCTGLALSTTAPNISTPETAYYQCTPLLVGELQFTAVRDGDNVTLAALPLSVPQPQVTLSISNGAGVQGELVLTLDPAKAPLTVRNFLAYVHSGFYVDTVFHRHVPGFIVQGGGFARPLVAGGTLPTLKDTNAPILLEDSAGLLNLRGTVAMARAGSSSPSGRCSASAWSPSYSSSAQAASPSSQSRLASRSTRASSAVTSSSPGGGSSTSSPSAVQRASGTTRWSAASMGSP